MRYGKRILTLIIAAILTMYCGGFSVLASDTNAYTFKIDAEFQAVNSLRSYLEIYEKENGIDSYTDYYISSARSYDYYSYEFDVFAENECIGKLMVCCQNNNYITSFYEGCADDAINFNSSFQQVPFDASGSFLTSSSVDNIYGYTISADYSLLEIPHIANAAHPDISGQALCWAAATASIVSYRNNLNPISAMQMYYNIKSLCPGSYPVGNANYISLGFHYYNVSINYAASGMTRGAVITSIVQNRPDIYESCYCGF